MHTLRVVFAAVVAASLAQFAWPEQVTPAPDDDRRAARVELGRRLFFDPAVSRGGRISCASCHDPARGFTDTKHPSDDEWGHARRRTMPLADLSAGPLHSDGEFATLGDLIDARIAPLDILRDRRRGERHRSAAPSDDASFPSSYGGSKADPIALVRPADRLAGDGFYDDAFAAAFGDDAASHDRISVAVQAYVRSLRTSQSPFDRFLAGDDAALTAPAARGLALFTGRAGCAQCHDAKPADGRAPLRDGKFHDTGVSLRTALAAEKGRVDVMKETDPGRGAIAEDSTDRRRDRMKFKTPSLRDVAARGPFMHDGSFATLADVVEFYDGGNAPHDGLDPALKKLGLSADEKDDLIAFLLALSGADRPGLAEAPQGARTVRVKIVDPAGAPLRDVKVTIEPAGDRFRGADAAPAPAAVTTDHDGRVTIVFPATTHVRLAVDGATIAAFVPDCARDAEVVAVPAGQVALRVRAAPKMLPRSVRAVPATKEGPKGETMVERDGDTLTFTLVRKLADNEALYATAAPAGGVRSSRRGLIPDGSGGGALAAVIDVDLRGGATSAVDMTPKAHADDEARARK